MIQKRSISTLNKILLFGLTIILNVSCSSSSNGIDASPITGDYVYTTSKTMGGYEISGKWKLNITRNGDGDYSYTIIKTITDQMYGGNPKSETATGKFAKTLDNNHDWYLIGYGNAHISIPYGGFKEPPSEITMYGDGDTKHFLRVYSSNSSSTNSQSSNQSYSSNESYDTKEFKDISGDYYGESVMGYSVGVGQISITPSGRIGVYYNHGDLGNAKEFGNLVPSGISQNSNNLAFKFQKDAGGDYDIRVIKSSNQIAVVLTGVNWKVTATRSIKSSLADTNSQAVIPDTIGGNVNVESEDNNQVDEQEQNTDTPTEQAYQTSGNYIANGSEKHKVYFYNAPITSTRRNAYINSQEEVFVQKVVDGFGYIEFTNDRGEKSIGWLNMNDLILKP